MEVHPIGSIPEAVAQMEAIGASLPPADGVACFNRMYLTVTQAVGAAVRAGDFTSSAFLDQLDVTFANHYFAALAPPAPGAPSHRCWDVLLDERASTARTPLQFALAGMSAHINHDLVLALVETFSAMGLSPHDEAAKGDYDKVNALLDRLEPGIRKSFGADLPYATPEIEDVESDGADWTIAMARAAAWDDAAALWLVHSHPRLRGEYEDLLDRSVAAIGICLLLPVAEHPHPAGVPCRRPSPILKSLGLAGPR